MAKTTKRQAELIDEATLLTAQIKEKKSRLEEIKSLLPFEEAGNYMGKTGVLTITEKKKAGIIRPAKLLAMLKSQRKGKEFPNCVTVVMKEAKRFLSAEDINKITEDQGMTVSRSFK